MDAKEEFLKFVNQYNQKNEKIDLKINHTVRVEKICEELANSLKLTPEDVDLAKLCGLLHDIGRFEQIKKYDSYDDLSTLDHGNLGEIILKKNNFINRFTKKNHNTIFKAVKYHNKYHVPNTLTKRNRLFVDITRDADKLDIMYLFVKKDIYNRKESNIISKKIFQSIMNKQSASYKNVKSKADEIAVILAFVFDLKIKRSFEIIKENDYFNKMIRVQLERTENKEMIRQLKEIQEFVNSYIEEMITC